MWNRKQDLIDSLRGQLGYVEHNVDCWKAKAAILEKQVEALGKQLNVASNVASNGYDMQLVIGRNQSRMWTLENRIIQRDKEIAVLKYHAANPTFGSTHTPAVQEKKGKRK